MTPAPACSTTNSRRLVAHLVGLLGCLVLGACSGPNLSPWRGQPGTYDRLSPGQEERLSAARTLRYQRDALGAVRLLEAALGRDELHVGIAVALQEARLAALARGEHLPEIEQWWQRLHADETAPPAEMLWAWYAARADEPGGTLDRLVAARLDPDELASLHQLELLASDEPGCIWAHLGVAHTRLRMGRLTEARVALNAALALDGSHARSRRLEALVLAREGEDRAAVAALERWLERTADDPLVGIADRDKATLDLAAALLEAERYGAALGRLNLLIGGPRFDDMDTQPRFQAFVLRAAAREGGGDYGGALIDAESARVEAPTELMPWIQIAVLQQYRLDDLDAARRAWLRVEVLALDAPESERAGAFIYAQRARIELARIDGELAPEGDS